MVYLRNYRKFTGADYADSKRLAMLFNAQMDAQLGYPNRDTKTYCEEKYLFEDQVDGVSVYMKIKPWAEAAAQRIERKTDIPYSTLRQENRWPRPTVLTQATRVQRVTAAFKMPAHWVKTNWEQILIVLGAAALLGMIIYSYI